MNLKHKVKIKIANRNGQTKEVLESKRTKLPGRLIHFLFGEFSEVMILTPGETVQGVEIQEMRGDEDE